MRENRLSGLEGGAGPTPAPTPITQQFDDLAADQYGNLIYATRLAPPCTSTRRGCALLPPTRRLEQQLLQRGLDGAVVAGALFQVALVARWIGLPGEGDIGRELHAAGGRDFPIVAQAAHGVEDGG